MFSPKQLYQFFDEKTCLWHNQTKRMRYRDATLLSVLVFCGNALWTAGEKGLVKGSHESTR
jgi:hypothetical protein